MRDAKFVFALALIFFCAPGFAFSDSQLPPRPGDPSRAVNLGTLDLPRESKLDPGNKYMPCFRREEVLDPFRAYFDRSYFRFELAHPARLDFRMFEIPDTTIWLEIWDEENKTQIAKSRGGATEHLMTLLPKGKYLLAVVTDTTQRHQNGKNIARLALRVFPEIYPPDQSGEPIDLGTLTFGGDVQYRGALGSITPRNVETSQNFSPGECPILTTTTPFDDFDYFKLSIPREGLVSFSFVGLVDTYNWTSPIELFRKTNLGWENYSNRRLVLPPGLVELVLPKRPTEPPSIGNGDHYVTYGFLVRSNH